MLLFVVSSEMLVCCVRGGTLSDTPSAADTALPAIVCHIEGGTLSCALSAVDEEHENEVGVSATTTYESGTLSGRLARSVTISMLPTEVAGGASVVHFHGSLVSLRVCLALCEK